MSIRIDASQIEMWLDKAESKSQIAVKMLAQEGAKKFENYAKVNRPWTDRTGHAKQRLIGYVETFSDKTRINIAHGVYYGIYLELCNNKRFAILQKTVNAISPEILQGFNKLLGYLK